jgi:hypothetical protein
MNGPYQNTPDWTGFLDALEGGEAPADFLDAAERDQESQDRVEQRIRDVVHVERVHAARIVGDDREVENRCFGDLGNQV